MYVPPSSNALIPATYFPNSTGLPALSPDENPNSSSLPVAVVKEDETLLYVLNRLKEMGLWTSKYETTLKACPDHVESIARALRPQEEFEKYQNDCERVLIESSILLHEFAEHAEQVNAFVNDVEKTVLHVKKTINQPKA